MKEYRGQRSTVLSAVAPTSIFVPLIYIHINTGKLTPFCEKNKKFKEGDNLYFLQTLDFVASALTVISGFVAAGYIIAKGARIIYKEIRYEEKTHQ